MPESWMGFLGDISKVMRRSKARGAILEEMKKLKTHPRGDELFQIVRQRLPQMSLGTVYRNLDLLRRQGAISEFFCGDFNRYDGDVSRHHHFLCRRCRKLWDFGADVVLSGGELVSRVVDFRVEGHYVMFYGLCQQCLLEDCAEHEK